MQNLECKKENQESSTEVKPKYQNIFVSKEQIWKLAKHPVKSILKHYLCAIEYTTRKGFYHTWKHQIPHDTFRGISKNTITKIYQGYEETNALIITRGQQNRVFFQYPSTYPTEMAGWLRLSGGYTIMNREELNYLLDNLTDTDLNTYFVLKLIYEANARPSEGFKTWPKVLRETHLSITQNTLKKSLRSLEEKNLIMLHQITDKKDWKLSHLIINLNPLSQILRPIIPNIEPKTEQYPKDCAHLNQAFEESSLNQAITITPPQLTLPEPIAQPTLPKYKYQKADFNFYGLGEEDKKLLSPLEWRTIIFLLKTTDFNFQQLQESVMRFSRYYFGHKKFRTKLRNPIAFLVTHLKTKNTIFIEPEWFLTTFHHPEKALTKKEKEQEEIENQKVYAEIIQFSSNFSNPETQDGIDYVQETLKNLELIESEDKEKRALKQKNSLDKPNNDQIASINCKTTGLTRVNDLFTNLAV